MKQAAALATPIATIGAVQYLGASQTTPWPTIGGDFLDLQFWLTIVIVALAGAFGGVSYELLLRGGAIELPHRVKPGTGGRSYGSAPVENLIALGILGRAFVGAAAALSALLFVGPNSGHTAIALGVTSGAAAPAMIRLMRKQLLSMAEALSTLRGSARAPQGRGQAETAPRPVKALAA
jgi:hypothetical protein